MIELIGMAVLALMGALAVIAGTFEDLESDVGSQSNPNSQVQLAAQMNFLHRIYNKAISGEPVSNGMAGVIAGSTAMFFLETGFPAIFSLVVGALTASTIYGIFATTAFAGRTASQRRFRLPLYMDVMRYTTPTIIAHNFIAIFALVAISYIQWAVLGHPFPLAYIALIWGIAVGAIGSSVGDVHYGAEREFQKTEFGAGLNTALSGDIVRRGEAGLRNSIDNVWFCAKFGGPVTGLAFGLTVFLSGWITTVFGYTGTAIGAGIVIVFVLIILNRVVEVYARNTFGTYKEDNANAA